MFGLELAENELVYLLHDCPIGGMSGITGGERRCRSWLHEGVSYPIKEFYLEVKL